MIDLQYGHNPSWINTVQIPIVKFTVNHPNFSTDCYSETVFHSQAYFTQLNHAFVLWKELSLDRLMR